ncbi:MAG: DUF3048 domain-containing protein [Acidimicrobiales bacterium]
MRTRLLAAIGAAAVIAASCGGGSGDDTSATTPATAPPTTPATAPPSTEIVVGPPTTRGPAPEVVVEPLGELGSISVLSGEPAYRGVLGQVDPDRYVVAPVALPPAPAADGIAPLTGLPLPAGVTADHPAILAKIDNTAKGRPQEALAQADLVYEEMIEGGATRLAAVFHTNAPLLGPVRSGRTTDIALLGSLSEPIFAWSGANKVHAALLRRQSIVDLGAQSRGEYFRSSSRPGTYNLMVEAQDLRDIAAAEPAGGVPLPHFEYRNERVGLPTAAKPVPSVAIRFPLTEAAWRWDAAAAGWARTQGTTEHVDAQGNPVVARNVVVAEVPEVTTGSIDTAGSPVYEQVFLGSGRGWVFTDGHVIEVTWTKPSIRSVTTWTTADNVPVALVPGLTWVELARGSVTIG